MHNLFVLSTADSKDQLKGCIIGRIMQHFIRVYIVCLEKIFSERKIWKLKPVTPQSIESFQVFRIHSAGRIHKCIKGFSFYYINRKVLNYLYNRTFCSL